MDEEYKIVDNIIYTPGMKQQPDARGIGWVHYEYLLKHKDRIAQIDAVTGEKETFGAVLQKCVRAAIGLKAEGVQYGDVISVCTYNHLNSCVPHISSMFVGAKIAALDPTMSMYETMRLFKIAMPKLIFVGEESATLIENIIREVGCKTTIIVFGTTEKHISFLDFAKPRSEELKFQPTTVRDIKDVAVIMFSSGTSGFPKGICHTHFSILSFSSEAMKLSSSSVIAYAGSPYWNVFLIVLNRSILSGVLRVVHPYFDTANPWNIFNHKVTITFLNIVHLMMLYDTPKPDHIDTSDLKSLAIVGSFVSVDHMMKARSRFPSVCVHNVYGQTEVFQSISCFDVSNPKHIELMQRKSNSCGLPKLGITYKIADFETGKALGPKEIGELRVKTEAQLSGYYNMDSDSIWDKDGWLKTGDCMYYDDDCCFYIVDRLKEMFKYRSWHIVPAVLESILLTHPGVFRAVVIGIPHEIDENHPMAVIQLKRERNVSEAEIIKYVEDKVEDYHRLRGGVKFVDDFPLTPSQKVNRWKLRQIILQKEI